MHRVLCVVVDAVDRTSKIREIRLRPVGDPIRYWPGQYLMVGDAAAGAPPRPYSIANAPRPDGEITLLVSRVPDGQTSGWVHEQLAVGDRIAVAGPYGTFIGDPSTDTPVLCLAAGSGLAPILALTDAALRRGFRLPVTLVYSARSVHDTFDEGLMAWWTARHRRFRYVTTYTGADTPPDQLHGRIPEILGQLGLDLGAHSIYIAGSPEFVDDCTRAVLELGGSTERLHVEKYHPQAPAIAPDSSRLAPLN